MQQGVAGQGHAPSSARHSWRTRFCTSFPTWPVLPGLGTFHSSRATFDPVDSLEVKRERRARSRGATTFPWSDVEVLASFPTAVSAQIQSIFLFEPVDGLPPPRRVASLLWRYSIAITCNPGSGGCNCDERVALPFCSLCCRALFALRDGVREPLAAHCGVARCFGKQLHLLARPAAQSAQQQALSLSLQPLRHADVTFAHGSQAASFPDCLIFRSTSSPPTP